MRKDDIEVMQQTLSTLEKLLGALVYGGSYNQATVITLMAEVKMIQLLLKRELEPNTRELTAK